jgi:hypothetical protein
MGKKKQTQADDTIDAEQKRSDPGPFFSLVFSFWHASEIQTRFLLDAFQTKIRKELQIQGSSKASLIFSWNLPEAGRQGGCIVPSFQPPRKKRQKDFSNLGMTRGWVMG